MNARPLSIKLIVLGLALTAVLGARAAPTDLSPVPLITSSSTTVLPNVFLILDDSGSMGWDYMPDNAKNFGSGTYGAASSQCNGVAYNPHVLYKPAVTSTGTSYLNSSFTSAWTDGYKTTSGSTNLSTNFTSPGGDPAQAAFYYTYAGTQTTEALKNYYDTTSTFYRECDSTVSSTPTATITVAGSSSTSVTSITVGGSTITSGATSASSTRSTVASRIASAISLLGYSATSSGSVVTIIGPIGSAGLTPVVTPNPTNAMTFTATTFATPAFTKVTVSSTSGPGTFDLNGDGVVDAGDKDERVNFANWYSYYRTRILMMKTSAGLAFKPINDNFRVGYTSINNNTTSDYLGLSKFDATQKANWYAKLYAATPNNSTPLREALSNVGKMYAGKLSTLNGSAVVDPIEYACQQNFAILTTDGFWNGNAGFKLDGTAVGNQDGIDVRPMYDGAVQSQSTSQNLQTDKQLNLSTSQLQQWTQQLQSQTSSLQQRTGALQWQTNQQQTKSTLQWQTNLQKTTAPLQWQTNLQQTSGQLAMWTNQMEVKAPLLWSTNQKIATSALQWQTNLQATSGTLQQQTSQLQTQTTQLQKRTSNLQQQTSQLQRSTSTLQQSTMYLEARTSSNSGASWSSWGSVASCKWDTGNPSLKQCRYATSSGGATLWSAAAATWANVSSCTVSYSTNTSNGTTWSGDGTNCQYSAWSAPANVATCTNTAQSAGPTSFTVGTARQCTTAVSTPYTNVASCTTVATPDVNGQTTQCQYTGWSGWSGASSCATLAPDGTSPYTVGTATQCQSLVTSAWANTTSCNATTVPNGSGNTTQCQYLGYSGWANVAVGGTCTSLAQSAGPAYAGPAINCQLTGIATNYVTLASGPSCSVTYNNPGTSTAGAGGKATSACSNTGAIYSAWQNVGNSGSCISGATGGSGGGNVQCQMASSTPAYVTNNPPSCTTSYNAGGTSAADASGNVSVCSTAAFNAPAPIAAGGTCATSANVQCSTGAALAASYVTNYPVPSCSVTYNAGGSSTADTSGYVVTSCPTDGFAPSAKKSPAKLVGANDSTSCDWWAPHAGNMHLWCDAILLPPTYVTTFPPTCSTFTVSGSGFVTSDASGNIAWACATSLVNTGTDTYSPAQTVPSNATCNGGAITTGAGGGSVHCVTGAPTTAYVTTYPPTCATTYNGATGTSTAIGTSVVTGCPVNAAYSGGTNVGAGNTCDGSLPNVKCSTVGASTTYVTNYPPTCSINFNAAGTSTADTSGQVVTACPVNAAFNSWSNASGSCTPSATVNCQYAWGGWSNAGSCTANESSGAGTWSITSGTQCQYTAYSAWSNLAAATCTATAQGATSPYSVATPRNCRTINVTTPVDTPPNPTPAWIASGSCTATTPSGSFDSTGKNIQCQTITTGPTPVATCTPGTIAASSGNSWTATTCSNVTINLNMPVLACVTASPSAGNNYVTTTCPTPATTGPTIVSGCVASAAAAANNWTTTTCKVESGGTSDTLADVAEYYYLTDLRTVALGNNLSGAPGAVNGTDISANVVPKGGLDTAIHQHMTTFTLGLGARGRMVFDPNYQSSSISSGDFYAVKTGSTANGTTVCPWQTSGACNWPVPGADQIENIDDLWHTAVNGRGTYFSATDPSGLALGLSNALAGVSARLGAASAATTSTAFITPGDNFLFHSSYVSQEWTGELVRFQIDPVTGHLLSTADWSAQTQLDAVADYTTRKIYFNKAGALTPFVYANLTGAQQASFNLGNLLTMAQFCSVGSTCLSAADQTLAAGTNLVNYLRGDGTNAGALADNTKYYRLRTHRLGDLVSSESVYVKNAVGSFNDPGYLEFKVSPAITGRKSMVYVGSNDGMLHAFDASNGNEDWAYIPSPVIPNLHSLADKNYGTQHQYFVDASPVVGDICESNCTSIAGAVWKTILVGGLGGGGKGYYALDITDPTNPKTLWEFTDANMGFTYGNPYIVKLANKTWVVVFTSGYNNISGDGMGHLYVVNAATGAKINDISTGVGSSTSPSGLSRISVPVMTPGYDATARAVYGGDMEGNLWRFDINDNVGAAGFDAQLMATLRDAGGNKQPITAKPTVGMTGTTLLIYVGTGRYLGLSDVSDASQQSFYAIKDTMPTGTTPSVAIYGNPRTQGSFVQQTITIAPCPAGTATTVCLPGDTVQMVTMLPVDYTVNAGWFFDFPRLGERNNTDPIISQGALIMTTNLPSLSSCLVGGESFLYQVNYLTGGPTPTAGVISGNIGVAGIRIGNELASRPVIATLSNDTVKVYVQGSSGGSNDSSGGTCVGANCTTGGISDLEGWGVLSSTGIVRSLSWRELVQ